MSDPDNRCQFCGRFLKQTWYLTNDEPDGWQDAWSCSQDAKHAAEHPWAYGREPVDSSTD